MNRLIAVGFLAMLLGGTGLCALAGWKITACVLLLVSGAILEDKGKSQLKP